MNVFIIIGCYEVAQGTGLKLIPQNSAIVQFELTRAIPRSSNRLEVTILQGVWNIVHFEKGPLLCILL